MIASHRPMPRPTASPQALRISASRRVGAGSRIAPSSLSASRRFFGPRPSFEGLFYSHRLTGPAKRLSIDSSFLPAQAVSAPPA